MFISLYIPSQGPLYKILKLQGRVWFFGAHPFIILKNSHQDLSNEGSKRILSLLELDF